MAHLKDLIVNGASRFIGKAYGVFVGSFTGNLDGNAATSTTANTAKACSGNAATASKLASPRTLSLTGKAAGSTSFDGSANAAINVTSVNADTASKLSSARKINITGNATGAANFDGSGDISINTTVNESKHAAAADKATQDTNGRAFTDTNAYMHISILANGTDFNNVKTTGIYYCNQTTYTNRPYNSWGILTVYSIGTVKQEYMPDNAAVYYTRYYTNSNWTAWSKVAASTADTCTGNAATATKLQTPRTISLTGNASGSANFDGSGNVSINTTVNESKHAAAATGLDIYAYRPSDANIQKGDSLVRHFLATSAMSKNKPPTGDGHILSFAWDNNGGYDAQLCVNNTTGRLNMRGQNAGKWSDWLIGLDSGNFNNYAPTKTGVGASGTWNISVSGNAATSTKATSATTAAACSGNSATATTLNNRGNRNPAANGTKVVSGLNLYQVYNNGYPTTYGNVLSIGGTGGGEILAGWSGADAGMERLYYRNQRDTGTLAWSAWKTVAYTDDISNYAPSKTGSGASGTWGINISGTATKATTAATCTGNSATATKATTALNIPTSDVGGNIWIS